MRARVRQDAFDEVAAGHQLVGVERITGPGVHLRLRRLGHLRPHIGQRRQAEDVQIIRRRRPRMVRVLHAVLHQPHRALLQLLLGVGQAVDEGLDRGFAAVLGHEGVDVGEPAHDRPTAVGRQLAPHQIQRLNAVGTLIDHGDPRIAQILRRREMLRIPRTAVDLHGQRGDVEALVGQIGFQHRSDQTHIVMGLLRLGRVVRMLKIGLQRGPQGEGLPTFDERLGLQQHAAHIGVDHDRVSRAVGVLRSGQGTALQPVVGELDGGLIGGGADRQALQAGAQPRLVHHHEHGGHALVLSPDQPAFRPVIGHDAGRIAVDAHLVLEPGAGRADVALAQRAVLIDEHLGHDEQADALDPGRRALDPGQHQMDDVVGEVVLARRNPDLLAGDGIAAVAVGHRLGADQAQVRAALRLGQVHGPAPFAGGHLGQIHGLLLGRAVGVQAPVGPGRQTRIHREGGAGGGGHLAEGHGHHGRHPLAAMLGQGRKSGPAGLDHGLVGFLPAGRAGDLAIDPFAAFLIADAVQGRDDFLGEFGAFLEDLADQVRRDVGEAGLVGIAVDLQHLVQDERQVADRRLVGHGITLSL